MKHFNNDDFNDFFEEWEKFNNMMSNNRAFRNEMTELLRRMMDSKEMGGAHFDFRIIPVNRKFDGFNLPEDELKTEKGIDEDGTWESKHWESPDGSWSYTSFSRSSAPDDFLPKSRKPDYSERRSYDKETQEKMNQFKLGRLQKTLDLHVEREEYEKAAEIKKMMDEIKSKMVK